MNNHTLSRYCRWGLGLLLTLVLWLPQGASAQVKIDSKVKRILFLGNSITFDGRYTSYIETYLKLKYPDRNWEFSNLGLSSENLSGLTEEGHPFPRPDLHERLASVLETLKPDLVFACYGMNDGIYKPFDDGRFQMYKDGIKWLHDEVVKRGAQIILVTPPLFDPKKDPAYANVLDIYSDWLLSLRYTASWEVVDLHFPMRRYLEQQREVDSSFAFAGDAIHPGDFGHWFMAKQILKYLNENVEAYESVNAALQQFKNGPQILALVRERQNLMRSAWLTATKYRNPYIGAGLPLNEALPKAKELDTQILKLQK